MWGAGKLLAIAGALVATFLVAAVASMRVALRAREVTVPDLTNRTAGEATALTLGLGLTIRADDTRRTDTKIEAGRVLLQDPAPGTTTRRPRGVRVWISAGPRSTTVPSFAGETERAAALRVARDGLTLASPSEVRSPSYPSDVVVAQDPAAGVVATGVALLVNRVEFTRYVMPDLIGLNGDRAATVLRNRGFRVAVMGLAPSPGTPAGLVVRQRPAAGSPLVAKEPLSIEVSR